MTPSDDPADHDAQAVAALQALRVLDRPADPLFDALAQAAAAACRGPIALVALFDGHRQWFMARVGLAGPAELPRRWALGDRAASPIDDIVEVQDATLDARLADHPWVTGAPGMRFLAAAPLWIEPGLCVGHLCVLDRQPGSLDEAQRATLRHLAQAVARALQRRAPPPLGATGAVAGGEAAARYERARHKVLHLIEGTQTGTWEWNLQTGEVRLNDASAQMLGGTLAEIGVATQAARVSRIHPDDRPHAHIQLERHLRGEVPMYQAELRQRHRDGHWVWVRERGQLLTRTLDDQPEWMLGIQQDISAERAMQAEAQRNAQVLLSAIDAIDEAFVLYDPQDRLVLCNEKYRTLYATSRDLLVPGARFEDIVREGARRGQYPAAEGRVEAWVAERMAAHLSGNTTLIQRIDDGRTLRIVERKTQDGHLVGFRIDITDLVRATELAEQASQAKSEFIATVSHELRTPLTSINGFAELGMQFAEMEGHARFRAMFGRIHAAGQRMLALVNDLLDLSERGGGATPLQCVRTDLGHLLREVLAELQPQLRQHQLLVDGLAALPSLPVEVDGLRLQQVLRNVLANAVRFAPAGSRIEMSGAHLAGQGVELCVRDHGPGIPPDELEAIFEPFVQSSRTRDGSGGTGLGLSICRRLMAAHGGSIQAENAQGGGARIRLRLPAATVAQLAPPVAR